MNETQRILNVRSLSMSLMTSVAAEFIFQRKLSTSDDRNSTGPDAAESNQHYYMPFMSFNSKSRKCPGDFSSELTVTVDPLRLTTSTYVSYLELRATLLYHRLTCLRSDQLSDTGLRMLNLSKLAPEGYAVVNMPLMKILNGTTDEVADLIADMLLIYKVTEPGTDRPLDIRLFNLGICGELAFLYYGAEILVPSSDERFFDEDDAHWFSEVSWMVAHFTCLGYARYDGSWTDFVHTQLDWLSPWPVKIESGVLRDWAPLSLLNDTNGLSDLDYAGAFEATPRIRATLMTNLTLVNDDHPLEITDENLMYSFAGAGLSVCVRARLHNSLKRLFDCSVTTNGSSYYGSMTCTFLKRDLAADEAARILSGCISKGGNHA